MKNQMGGMKDTNPEELKQLQMSQIQQMQLNNYNPMIYSTAADNKLGSNQGLITNGMNQFQHKTMGGPQVLQNRGMYQTHKKNSSQNVNNTQGHKGKYVPGISKTTAAGSKNPSIDR